MKKRNYEELKSALEDLGFTVSVPKYRFIVEYTEDEYAWYFDNLSELESFVEGLEIMSEIMMP